MDNLESNKGETRSEKNQLDKERLVIPSARIEKLREDLIKEDELERYALVHCNPSGENLLVSSIDVVSDGDMAKQGKAEARPKLDVERDIFGRCASSDQDPLVLHSHPFTDHAGFSGTDLQMMSKYRDWLLNLYPKLDLSFGVLGRKNFETTMYDRKTDSFGSLPKRVIGNWKLDPQLESEERTTEEVDKALYDRNIRALTKKGQERISSAKVAIIGLGSLGSILAEQLGRLGVKDFVLVDHDELEESNIPRVFGAYRHHIGRPKVEVLKSHLWRVNPDAEIRAVQEKAEKAEEPLKEADIMMAGVDQVSARSFINEFAVRHLKYYIDTGSVIRADGDKIESMDGYVQLVAPGSNACFDCLRRGNPERARLESLSEDEVEEELNRGYIDGTDLAPEPAVVHLNSTVASLAVSVFSKLVAGYAEPPDFIRYESLGNELVEIGTRRSSSCITCGENGVLAMGEKEVSEEEVKPEERPDLDLSLDLRFEEDSSSAMRSAEGSEKEEENSNERETNGLLERFTNFIGGWRPWT